MGHPVQHLWLVAHVILVSAQVLFVLTLGLQTRAWQKVQFYCSVKLIQSFNFCFPYILKLRLQLHNNFCNLELSSIDLEWTFGYRDWYWVGRLGAWQSLKYCLLNFIHGSLRDNDNCSWQLEKGGESGLSQSGETREGDMVATRPWLLCFKGSLH